MLRRHPKLSLACALIVCLALCWLGWSYIARQRLQREIDLISQANEPVYPADFNFSAVPDKENAAYYYRKAFQKISSTAICPSASNYSFVDYPPFTSTWYAMTDQAVAADTQALALAHQAHDFDRADWGVRFRPGASPASILLPFLNPSRNLANLLGDAATDAHMHGHDDLAFARIEDLLHLASATQQQGLLVGRLVDIGIEALAVTRVEVISLNFHLAGSSANGVSRVEVLSLIRQLLDDSDEIRRAHQTMLMERVLFFDGAQRVHSNATILRPMVDLAMASALDQFSILMRSEEAANWPQCQAITAALPPGIMNPPVPTAAPPRFSHLPGFFYSMSRYELTEYRVASERRLAAISLAVNLYRLDHGFWPKDLQTLVGPYLPAVPADLFCAGQPIGYVILPSPSGMQRPMLYFEPSGKTTNLVPPSQPAFGWQITQTNNWRQWRDISDWWLSPATQPSSPQAVDH
jgi:hypothetical protein